ncbi:MAG: hypothetical protein PHY09_12660 [Desulfuromonadaceae bacterium]|nr:hypothetical protein [Desulfuromonadaceae bacterium]MDD5105402.1 hypothetical protein [Desulfuromonadaceae bacterium]
MKKLLENRYYLRFVMLITLAGILLLSGCARYARNSDTLYEPSTPVRGGTGDLYVVIPENQQTLSPDIKRVIGTVSDGANVKLDDVVSSRSAAEIIQTALGLELKRSGYTVKPVTKRPEAEQRVIDLTKTEIKLDQLSEFTSIKATCQVVMGMDVYKAGQLVKRLQYEATSSKTDIKDRDMLAGIVLQEALQAAMLQAVPDIYTLFSH